MFLYKSDTHIKYYSKLCSLYAGVSFIQPFHYLQINSYLCGRFINRRIMMKKILSAAVILAASIFAADDSSAQKRVSILGDSYSTFEGYTLPETNIDWYKPVKGRKDNNVRRVEQTWWWQFIADNGMQFDTNNSYSGSTVCTTGYNGDDYSDRAFITRMLNLGSPDIILVFGGTNDCWAKSPLGDFKYEGWTKVDLTRFRPAFAYMLASLREFYPEARIFNITNTELTSDYTTSIDEICRHYSVPNLQLVDIHKQVGHPSAEGMKAIADQLSAFVKATN